MILWFLDQHLISRYSNTAKSLIKIKWLQEMIANPNGVYLKL